MSETPWRTTQDWACLLRVGDRMHWTGQGLMDITAIENLPATLGQPQLIRVIGVLCERRMTVDLELDDVVTFDTRRTER